MKKSPAFQFYPTDYLADSNVALMTLEQEGAYIRLLSYCWTDGDIPFDMAALGRLCKTTSEHMEQLWEGLKNCFVFSKRDSTKLIHPRLEEERKKQRNFSKRQSDKAKTRWSKEKSEYATALPGQYQTALPQQCSSSSSSFPSSNKNISRPRISDENMEIAKEVFEGVLRINPNTKKPNLETWAGHIRKMRELDGRPVQEIRETFKWANQDIFWQTNILSTEKLREQYDQLRAKISRGIPLQPEKKTPWQKILEIGRFRRVSHGTVHNADEFTMDDSTDSLIHKHSDLSIPIRFCEPARY